MLGWKAMIDITTAALVFSVGSGLFFLGLWLYYDRRDHRLFERERRRTIYHCVRCSHLYSQKGEGEDCACPRCAHVNTRLRY